MTLRQRIEQHLAAHPASKFTNRELASELLAPEPSVRRATLRALVVVGSIAEAGKTVDGAFLYSATGQARSE